MLHLYVGSKRYSSWSLRPFLALGQSGLGFECTTILLDRETTRSEIAKVNPTGKVPVLHDGDLVIWDSLAICEYVHELAPEARLWPVAREARARARAISAEMHSGFAALRKHLSMELHATRPPPTDPAALADIERVKAIWNDCLAASGGPFLFGAFTIADAMFAPVATRFTTYQVAVDPPCRAYIDAIADLPAMRRWLEDAAAEPISR